MDICFLSQLKNLKIDKEVVNSKNNSPSLKKQTKTKSENSQIKEKSFKNFKEFFEYATENCNSFREWYLKLIVKQEKIEQFYAFYIKLLSSSTEKICKHISFMVNKLKPEEQKKFLEKVIKIFIFFLIKFSYN